MWICIVCLCSSVTRLFVLVSSTCPTGLYNHNKVCNPIFDCQMPIRSPGWFGCQMPIDLESRMVWLVAMDSTARCPSGVQDGLAGSHGFHCQMPIRSPGWFGWQPWIPLPDAYQESRMVWLAAMDSTARCLSGVQDGLAGSHGFHCQMPIRSPGWFGWQPWILASCHPVGQQLEVIQ